jgi:hypothetical protein
MSTSPSPGTPAPSRRERGRSRWPTPASTSPSPAASHAAAAPHLGRSALDAVELMNVGVNYMREHMPSDARIHYAYLDAGGIAPNVVQAKAKVRYLVRAHDLPGLRSLVERVRKIADGAALMTETTVDHQRVSAVSNLLGNTRWRGDAGQLLAPRPAALRRGGPRLRREIQATLSPRISPAPSPLGVPVRRACRWPTRSPLEPPARPWWAPPMWATSPGWCRRCRRAARRMPSARRAIPGS